MPDVTSEASLRFTSTGADKAAADARKLEDSLKSVQRQAQRTAASLKSPLGIPAAGGTAARPVSRLAAGRAEHPKAAALGDKIGQAFGNALANTIIAAFTKKTAGIGDGLGKQQEAAGRAVVAQAEATTKAVEAEAKATAKAAESGLKSSGKASEAKAKSTAKTAEDETKATTKAAQTQLKTTVQASEAKTKATVRSGDAELKAVVLAGEAKARAAAKAADAEAKAALKSSKAAEARSRAVATSLRTAGQIIAPVTSLIPPVLTGIAAAGSGLGLLGAAAIAVAAPVTLLIKSFGWISDAAEEASKNFRRAQDVMRGGTRTGPEQARQESGLTALTGALGKDTAGKVTDQFNKLAIAINNESLSEAAQKQLKKFEITKDAIKAFEDETGKLDPFKAFGQFVKTQDLINEAIDKAEQSGDPAAIEKAHKTWDEWVKTLKQIGPDFQNAVTNASKATLDAGERFRREAIQKKPPAEASDDAGKFDIAVNRMKGTWDRLFQVVGEGAMPAATAAVDKWADVLVAVSPKLAEIGKHLTTEAWSGLGDLADYLKKTIDDIDVKAALSYLKGEWLAFWNTLKGVGAEVSALVGTFNEVKEAVKGFFSEGKTIWETTKQEFGLVKDALSIIGDMGQNTKREWEALRPVVTAVGAVLKRGWDDFVADATEQWPKIKELAAGVFRTITDAWNTFEGAVRRGFESLKEFIVGLTGRGGVNRNAPPSNAEDDLPGLRRQMSFGGSDINLDNARFQQASFGTGTAGAEMRGNIDRALIHISGTMQAIIQNASIMGRTGLDTGPAGVQNASWGGAGTGGFGSGGAGAPSSGRIAGVGSHDFGGTSLGRGMPGSDDAGARGSAPAPGKLGERQSQAMRFATDQLRKEGVPEANLRQAAAHLVGQATMESGLDPTKTHDVDPRTGKPTGYGIYGARDPTPGKGRKTGMLNWMREQGFAPDSLEGQTRYMAHEAMSGRYPQTKRALMEGQGPGATDTITKEFESPAVVNARSGAVRQAFGAGGGSATPAGPAAAAGGDLRGGGADRGAHRGGAYTAEEVARNRPATEAVAERLRAAGIGINSTYRSESHHLSKANPSSMHVRGRAIDLKARTPAEGAANLAKAREALSAQGFKEGVDYNVLDETGSRRSAHATGSHLHLSMTRAGIAKQLGEQPGGGDGGGESIKTAAATPSAPAPAASAAQPALGPAQALALAQQNLGANEITDRSKLASFFKSAGYNIDPKTIAWCSTYTAASLKRAGIEPPQNAAVASSFLNWGQGVDPNQGIQAGDVVVQKRHRDTGAMLKPGQPGGHVGLATGKTRVNPKTGRLEIESIEGNTLNAQGRGGFVAPQWEEASEHSVRRAPPRPDGGPITRPDVAGNQPIIVPQRAVGIDKSTVAAQGPAADGAAARTFKSASEGAAFGQSAAESIRKGLEGTNIPVSGVPSTSRGVSPNTGPKSTGGDAPTTDV